MRLRRHNELPSWTIPTLYAFIALLAALTLPRIEARVLPQIPSGITPSAAQAIYTSIGSGMLAMTGIVFSLVFVMVQFSAVAYSPRLVSWIAKDKALWHSLGVFTATFLYSIAAIAWLDRSNSGRVPLVSGWLVILLLLASVMMFIALVAKIPMLQISSILSRTGGYGRSVIENMYPPLDKQPAKADSEEVSKSPVTQVVLHTGSPKAIQGIDGDLLVRLASKAGGIVEVVSSIGDTVVKGTVLMRVHGAMTTIKTSDVMRAMEMGSERTFNQDPKYAIRILVDIAIKALSPAVNDPTTAVQALDQIEDLLLRLGQKQLQICTMRDTTGALRVVIPFPDWEDFLTLSFDEIRFYGAQSVQVMRRMKALTADLIAALPPERHELLLREQEKLSATITRTFEDAEERREASVEDRQGLGVPRKISS